VSSTRVQQWQEGGSTLINELKNIFITFMAATAVISGSMTLGMMLAVQYIIGQLNVPINEFVNFIRELLIGSAVVFISLHRLTSSGTGGLDGHTFCYSAKDNSLGYVCTIVSHVIS
jgi:ABC-type multidrug transport system fused ATPase/permease subunit